MRKIDVFSDFGPGTTPAKALLEIAEQLTLKEQGCWLTYVDEILILVQGKDDWKIKYRINNGTVTRPIRTGLAQELLAANMVGKPLTNVSFIHNLTRIEEAIVLE